MKTEAVTLIKEDVLSLGQMVNRSVEELARLLQNDPQGSLQLIEQQEEVINRDCQEIEERCLDLITERKALSTSEIHTLWGSTIIAAKFERMADHANRIAKTASWASADRLSIPPELSEMATVVHTMVKDVLLSFLADDAEIALSVVKRDNQVDYLHDYLSKRLLSELGCGNQATAQMQAQFLFAARFLERMGDACTSIGKRVYFMVTGERFHQ